MAINLSDNILAKTTAPGDAKYGPYSGADLAAAKTAATTYLQSSFRYEGLTVGLIIGSNPIVEYWFQGGVTDNDLVLKSQGGGDVAVKSSGASVQTAADEFDFVSGIKATAGTGNAVTIDTTFNSSVADDLEVGTTVGGVSSGTKASTLKDLNMVALMETILFPTQLPQYNIPSATISVTGWPTNVEVGVKIQPSITAVGNKNDTGDTDGLTITFNDGSAVSELASGQGTQASIANNSTQFGVASPNDPNYKATLTASQKDYIVPGFTGTSRTFTYTNSVDFLQGLKRVDNKGVTDSRAFGTGANKPQAAQPKTKSFSKTAYYPYYWGKSATQKSAAEVAGLIAAGTYTSKQVKSAAGTLSMDFAASGEWVWFAIPEGFNTKTEWYVSASNFGDIGADPTDLFAAGSIQSIASVDGYWTKNFKVYVAQKVTTIGLAQIRE